MIHLVFLKGIGGGRADESFRAQRALKQRKNEMKIGENVFGLFDLCYFVIL